MSASNVIFPACFRRREHAFTNAPASVETLPATRTVRMVILAPVYYETVVSATELDAACAEALNLVNTGAVAGALAWDQRAPAFVHSLVCAENPSVSERAPSAFRAPRRCLDWLGRIGGYASS